VPSVKSARRPPLGGAKAGGFSPSASVHVPPGGAKAGGIAPTAIVLAVFYPVLVRDGWHPAADHHDLIAFGTELLAVIAFIFVSGKLVARRLFR
jgi:hypothetical protein